MRSGSGLVFYADSQRGFFSMSLGFFLTFLVLFHLLPCLSGQAYVNGSSNPSCPDDFECQNIGRMGFPFANFTQPDCGLCMVDCLARPLPTIRLSSSSGQPFQVKRKLQNNVLQLHDANFHGILRNHYSSCNVFYYDTILPNSSSISFTIKSNITLFRCCKTSQLLPQVVNYFTTNQFKRNESCQHFDIYYKNPKSCNHTLADKPFLPGCSVLHLPVRENASEDTELLQWLTADFDLEWHLSERCYHDCHLKGGRCETVDTKEFHCANYLKGPNARRSKFRIIPLIAAGGVAVLVGILVFFWFRKKLRFYEILSLSQGKTGQNHDVEAILKKYGSVTPKRYHYSELKKMTNSFEIKLGQGGYGSVYKGKTQDGTPVAVKLLTNNKESNDNKGNGEEFVNEVASISRTSHVNIVTLLGFCYQGDKKALVYEFMENGSLDKFIYSQQLDWPTLYRIAVEIARGLEYLHRGCNTRILHFDIKPNNILLDRDFCPKISDFGLAKLCPGKESAALSSLMTTVARGTIGYIAPEVIYRSIGGVSHKSDVYSYGMMVLEMIGGRKNVNVGVDSSSEFYFPDWIYKRLDDHQELGLPGLMLDEGGAAGEENQNLARKMIIVSLWCIQTHPSNRPTITNVLDMFEWPLEALRMPPKPFFSSPSAASLSLSPSSSIKPFSC